MSTDVPSSVPSGEPSRKGSVKRARQMLDAGVRQEQASPPQQMRQPQVPRDISHQPQWPLPDSGLPPHPINQHPRYMIPRGPPPLRPFHPSELPSPSIYSERDGPVSERSSSPSQRPPRSFSQLQPPPLAQSRRPMNDVPASPASPTSTIDMTPRISIATDDLFRQSVASSTPSVPDVPQFPPTFLLSESGLPQDDPRHRTAGLVAPLNMRQPGLAPQSSVPPIPEEFADPRLTKCSVASSRAIPLSWGSGPAESEILGAYLDIDSDDGQRSPGFQEDDTRLVRNASIGKRGKPTMRTILRSNPVSVVDMPTPTEEESSPKETAVRSIGMGGLAGQVPRIPSQLRNSSTTASSESVKGVDPEKPPFAPHYDSPSDARLEKELEAFGALPTAAPTMSDKRPGGHKPPALNMHALRDAEARGSLSSLSDLIKRATKLASNLDHGRTASRANNLAGGDEAGYRVGMGHRPRKSGSLSDMLASFPPPGLATPENRGSRTSWPFFGRSNLRNVEQLHSNEDDPNAPPRRKMCCGMPRKIFVIICIAIFIIVVLAILLPVFLVAVPREKAGSSCAEKHPCENGGVSVSAGTQCSCVCSNSYTGSQCNIAGDSSCTTALVNNGSNATMGSSLPILFEESKEKFNITLDSVTIMALFSINNVSCTTENELVAFSEVTSDNTSKTRRSVQLIDDSTPSLSETDPTPVLAVRSEATLNGILYDDSESSKSSTTTSTPTQTESATTATATKISVQSTAVEQSTSTSTSTVTSVPENVIGFSRVAVLYILQKTGSLDTALASEEDIQGYLVDSYANATQPAMKVGEFKVDFEKLTITLPNSTVKAQ
ncbi:hypothetical protein PEX1_020480 [Penicillium expansum]|uniref:EGF-like domain-containing protein n=1 Tax=Penicillium expansum TaxID=27334 RepID=A0A0A2KE24_PENEN|nr:hypothetical protein PEX2_019780 [Penicillium expansum]KGO37299.1 hypothetical protein PEXP_003070 [Penicillium expansum]KGO57534.1 hypothetical protein PEX2_019780 [Penicillium expansum]KGO66082.1 hypothetical protein PEX1_020480 [Penicillium expansum]